MNQEEEQASLTWRVSPDMMCMLDEAGRFVAVNPAWRSSLGWERCEILGRPYVEFLHPDDVARSLEAFEVVRSGVPVLRFENRYRTTSGEHRWFSWVAVPEGGRFFCTARDITQDKEHIETIVRQNVEAALREQFLAVLSHDLRNPLAALGAGVRLLTRSPGDDRSTDILEQMRGSVSRMTELVDNLMDLARVRLGDGIGLDLAATSTLEADLEGVIEEIRLIAPKGTAIDTSVALDGPVRCDAARVKQVLSNLLSNAVMHGAATRPIRVEVAAAAGRLRLSVVNDGDPIPPAARERLFLPFLRSEVLGSRQGLGLGLYIASEIAKAHGGALSVTSTASETRFTLDIPA